MTSEEKADLDYINWQAKNGVPLEAALKNLGYARVETKGYDCDKPEGYTLTVSKPYLVEDLLSHTPPKENILDKPECPCEERIDSKACAGCPQDEARKDRDKDKCVNKHFILRNPTQKESDSVLCYEFGSCAYCPFYGEEQKNIYSRADNVELNDRTASTKKYEPQNYRPFKDCDELVEFWTKRYQTGMRPANTMPLIWVFDTQMKSQELVEAFVGDGVMIVNEKVDFGELLEYYQFLDGSPCGIKEEEEVVK